MITPANALKFSLWLASQHPQAFAAVLAQVTKSARPGLSGVPTYLPARSKRIAAHLARGRFGRFGRLGDVYGDIEAGTYDANARRMGADTGSSSGSFDGLQEFTPTLSYESDPVLADINVNIPSSGFDLSQAASSVDSSGGFWSSLGSGLSSIGSGLSSAIGAVAGAVLNPGTLSAAGNLAATVIKATGANAQQQAVLQSQIARTQNGSGAHPVTYVTNPATGQPQAMLYNPNTGQYQAASVAGSVGSLFGSMPAYAPYVFIGGGLLITALVLKR